MIFGADMIRAISQGKKSQTRRPLKPGQHKAEDCFYQPGHVYSVHEKRGEKRKLVVTVVDVRVEWLGEISLDDVRREGFRSREAFLAKWHQLYGPKPPAHVTELERDDWLVARRQRLPLKEIPCRVFVISFVAADLRDRDRWMRAGQPIVPTCQASVVGKDGKRRPCGRGLADGQETCAAGHRRPPVTDDDSGYTTTAKLAVRGELPVIPAALQDEYSKRARESDASRDWRPIHGRAARLADEISERRAQLSTASDGKRRKLQREIRSREHALARVQQQLGSAA